MIPVVVLPCSPAFPTADQGSVGAGNIPVPEFNTAFTVIVVYGQNLTKGTAKVVRVAMTGIDPMPGMVIMWIRWLAVFQSGVPIITD